MQRYQTRGKKEEKQMYDKSQVQLEIDSTPGTQPDQIQKGNQFAFKFDKLSFPFPFTTSYDLMTLLQKLSREIF